MNASVDLPRLGAYRIERLIGQGGMGEVLLAWDERLHRHVAIKRVRHDKADALHRTRFRREAQAAARLSHPAIVQVYDVLETEQGDCIVMEHVQGVGLDELIGRGPLALGDALGFGRDIAEGLAEAHDKGLVHRDLKAANVRVTTAPPRAKVLDFGIAVMLDDTALDNAADASSDPPGAEGIAGTIYAMSPEQALGRPVDHRCDLFALGGLLYHMLAGCRPFRGKDVRETIELILSREPPRIRTLRPGVPAAVEKLVDRLLAKSPARRPADTRWVAAELGRLAALCTENGAPLPELGTNRDSSSVSTIYDETLPEVAGMFVRTLVLSNLVSPEGGKLEVGAGLRGRHDEQARDLRGRFRGRHFAEGALVFQRPAEAVGYALAYHQAVDDMARDHSAALAVRTAIHLGEVSETITAHDEAAGRIVSRLETLAETRQILLTRAAFDLARHAAVAGPLAAPDLRWLAHGSYLFEALNEPLEVCEVGTVARSPLAPPSGGIGTARRLPAADDEPALGWRPAAGQPIPRRPDWELLDKIGEGGFGEVWLAVHPTGEKRAFKFCFEAARIRALRREVTLLRLLKESLGHRADIARLHDWSFEQAPFFLELEYSDGGNLVQWAEASGGLAEVHMETRLELVAQAAEALAAAHSVGVLHKDVKPHNVLIRLGDDGRPYAVLTDFGIGAVTDPSKLREAAFTVLGFTDTTPSTPTTDGGTPGYMAPERLEGKPPTVRSDVYSLGVVLFQVAVGDLGRAIAPGWQREVADEVLRDDLADFVDGDPERRPERVLKIAERLRSLEARRLQRQEAETHRAALANALRRRRVATWFAAAAAVLALVIAFFGARAERARRQAQNLARATVASHLLSRGQVWEGSLLLLEVREADTTPTAVESLHEALAGPVEIAIFRGHEDAVENAAWSPDGERVLTASHDGTARIWTREGEPLVALHGHTEVVWNALWSPDGTRALTVAFDRTGMIWETATGKPLAVLAGHTAWLRGGGWHPDDERVFTVSEDGTARTWDAGTGQSLSVFQHPGQLWEAAWSPDGTRLLTACEDGRARIWNVEDGALLLVLQGHEDAVRAVAWSPDGTRVLTGSTDATARIWEARTGRLLKILEGHRRWIKDAAWSPDGLHVLTVAADRDGRIWNVETGAQVALLRGHGRGIWDGAWSPDGTRVVTNSDDFTARVWHPQTGTLLAVLRGHDGRVWSTAWSADSRRILTASEDGTARVWHLGTGEAIAVLSADGEFQDVSWSPDGTRVVTASTSHTAQVWDLPSGEPEVQMRHETPVVTAVWSPDGASILTTAKDRGAYVWDRDGERLSAYFGSEHLLAGSWSASGSRVATVSSRNTVRIWDPLDGRTFAAIEHDEPLWDVAWSPDGTRIATAVGDGTVSIRGASSDAELTVLEGHRDPVQAVAWNADATRIATASRDRTARVWDAASGETLALFSEQQDWVQDVAWSPDGLRLLTAGGDRVARLWDAETGEPVSTAYRGHVKVISAVAWSPDGQRFATASQDATVRIWAVPDDYPAYLQARLRARNQFCLEPTFHREFLDLSQAQAERRHRACEACVPAFFERLSGAPLWQWQAYADAWEVYEACFFKHAGD